MNTKCFNALFFFLIVGGLIFSCKNKHNPTITAYLKGDSRNTTYYLERIGFFNEPTKVVDSVFSKQLQDTIVFDIPIDEQRLYQIRSSENRMKVIFINDTSTIKVHVDYFRQEYWFSGSRASTSLKDFENDQTIRVAQSRMLHNGLEKLKRIKPDDPRIDSLTQLLAQRLREISERNIAFADTVHSPAAFVQVYNLIDLSSDHIALREFIVRASERFPNYKPIQTLKQSVESYIKILEEEFQVGEVLPDLTLPDRIGKPFSITSLRGKFIWIDLWSTWCPQCLPYTKAGNEAKQVLPAEKFERVSIAIDAEHETWLDMTAPEKIQGIQLIDEKMWQGPAVNTWKFDSIPYNYLISPQGRILKKAIPPDSVVLIIQELMKKDNEARL